MNDDSNKKQPYDESSNNASDDTPLLVPSGNAASQMSRRGGKNTNNGGSNTTKVCVADSSDDDDDDDGRRVQLRKKRRMHKLRVLGRLADRNRFLVLALIILVCLAVLVFFYLTHMDAQVIHSYLEKSPYLANWTSQILATSATREYEWDAALLQQEGNKEDPWGLRGTVGASAAPDEEIWQRPKSKTSQFLSQVSVTRRDLQDRFEDGKAFLMQMLERDYGQSTVQKVFLGETADDSTIGRTAFLSPPETTSEEAEITPSNTTSSDKGSVSWNRLKEKLIIKLLQVLTSDSQNDGRVIPFVWATGGHEAAAGHGNLYNQSYTAYLERALQPVFGKLGLEFVGRNRAGTGQSSGPEIAFCSQSIFGPDVDLLTWDYEQTDTPLASQLQLYFYRAAVNGRTSAPAALVFGWSEERIQALAELQERGMATFYLNGDSELQSSTRYQMISGIPDTSGRERGYIDSMPEFVRNFKCHGQLEGGDPKCIAARHDTSVCPNRPQLTDGKTRPGWKMHAFHGNMMALFILEVLHDAIEDITNAPAGQDLTAWLKQLQSNQASDQQRLAETDLPLVRLSQEMPNIPFLIKREAYDFLYKGPMLCHTALLPSQLRYEGLLGDVSINDDGKVVKIVPPTLLDLERGIGEHEGGTARGGTAHSDTVDKQGPHKGPTMRLVADMASRPMVAREGDEPVCKDTLLNTDHRDYFYLHHRDEMKILTLPNAAELERYPNLRRAASATIALCYRQLPAKSKNPPGNIRGNAVKDAGGRLKLEVNRYEVKDMIPMQWKKGDGVTARPRETECYWLKHGRGLRFMASPTDGAFTMDLTVTTPNEYIQISSVLIWINSYRLTEAEEGAKRKAAEEAAAKAKAEAEAKKREAEAAAKKAAAEAESKKKVAEQEAARTKAQEEAAAAKKAAEAEAARQKAEAEVAAAKKKALEDAATAKKRAEEEARKQAQMEAEELKKQAEELEAHQKKQKAEAEDAKKAAEEAAKKAQAEQQKLAEQSKKAAGAQAKAVEEANKAREQVKKADADLKKAKDDAKKLAEHAKKAQEEADKASDSATKADEASRKAQEATKAALSAKNEADLEDKQAWRTREAAKKKLENSKDVDKKSAESELKKAESEYKKAQEKKKKTEEEHDKKKKESEQKKEIADKQQKDAKEAAEKSTAAQQESKAAEEAVTKAEQVQAQLADAAKKAGELVEQRKSETNQAESNASEHAKSAAEDAKKREAEADAAAKKIAAENGAASKKLAADQEAAAKKTAQIETAAKEAESAAAAVKEASKAAKPAAAEEETAKAQETPIPTNAPTAPRKRNPEMKGYLQAFDEARDELFGKLKKDYGVPNFDAMWKQSKLRTIGRSYWLSPHPQDDDQKLPDNISWLRLKRIVLIKLLQAHRAKKNNNKDAITTFVWASGGHSAAASHGNLFSQSYTAYMEAAIAPVFKSVGLEFIGRNYAIGAQDSAPEVAFCAQSMFGTDIQVLSWDYGMTDSRSCTQMQLYAYRGALGSPSHPAVVAFASTDKRAEALSDLQQRGMATLYVNATAKKLLHAAIPDTAERTVNPAYIKHLKCKGALEKGEPTCGDQKFDESDKSCMPRKYQTSWHPGWKVQALEGNSMALLMLEVLRDAVDDMQYIFDYGKELKVHEDAQKADMDRLRETALPESIAGEIAPMDFARFNPTTLDMFFKSPVYCHTALLPAEVRYRGYLTGKQVTALRDLEVGIKLNSHTQKLEEYANKGTSLRLVADMSERQLETLDKCPSLINIDHRDYFYLTQEEGEKSMILPNLQEKRAYGYGRMRNGFIAVCWRIGGGGTTGIIDDHSKSYGKRFSLAVNGLRVTELVNFAWQEKAKTKGTMCHFLKNGRSFRWNANENGEFELGVKVLNEGESLRISSVLIWPDELQEGTARSPPIAQPRNTKLE